MPSPIVPRLPLYFGRWVSLFAVSLTAALLLTASTAAAQDNWTVERFDAEIAINRDSTIDVVETISIDFGDERHHGIVREIPVRYEYDGDTDRVYRVTVHGVRDAAGAPVPFSTDGVGADIEIKIGDPDRLVTGAQTYVIAYAVDGALNSFSDRDELYWNVNGDGWPPTREASATVRLDRGLQAFTCFQGAEESTEPCDASGTSDEQHFAASRPLGAGEGLTIVSSIRKGAVEEPHLFTEAAPRSEFERIFTISPLRIAIAAALAAAGVVLLGAMWWRRGRDREFTSIPLLTGTTEQRTRWPFGRRDIVVEYTPTENLAPAEMGLLQHERLDDRDATATIVHLAVRGHLTIRETDEGGLFGGKDFVLTKRDGGDTFQPFERALYDAIFKDRDSVALSDLKSVEYGKALERSHDLVAERAVRDRWFSANPRKVRQLWAGAGTAVIAGGALAAFGLGKLWGAGLLGLPVATTGAGMIALSGAMPARTAQGSELLRRVLGFRLYIDTAESRRSEFYERANIFAEYLPYAIGFECVDRWAKAFEGVNTQPAVERWYSGPGSFTYSPMAMAAGMRSFSSEVQGSIRASTPGGRGSSGFGGGFSGGGGGGGGGRSW